MNFVGLIFLIYLMSCESIPLSGVWLHCGDYEFYVSSISTSEHDAHTMCTELNYLSILASLDDAQIIKDHCIQVLHNGSHWIDDFCQNTCSVLSKNYINGIPHIENKSTSCSYLFFPICRPITSNIPSPRTNTSCQNGLSTSTRKTFSTVLKSTTDVSTSTYSTRTESTSTPNIGTPSTGTTRTGIPRIGISSTGTPRTGTYTTSTPSTGTYSTGASNTGTRSTGTLDTPSESNYFINHEFTNYQEADDLCNKKYNASLITCPSITSYFKAIRSLNLGNGRYWIGGSDSSTDCLFYNSSDNFISTSGCDNELKSICRRYPDSVDDMLGITTFKKLIEDMTVNKSETFIANMKLNCLDDERTSAKMVGSFGIIVMVAVGAVFVSFDAINLFRCCKVTT